ncbi:hypothetical protein EB73_20785 [Mycobacterium sp. SWH-M3]|nr:hypothetical protein EB73_20785 [Mycobacterium sp. SWH-M3]
MVCEDEEPPGYGGYTYDICDAKRVRVLHSRADAFHIAREHVPELHVWSDPYQFQVGFKFWSICAEKLAVCGRAAHNHSAAVRLRKALRSGLASVDAQEDDHRELRDLLVAEFAAVDGFELDPFDDIFRFAQGQASMLFGERWPGVKFQIAARDDRCFREGCDLFVNASTDLRVGDLEDSPAVRVSIWWERFNWESFGALFALLVHELVCHVASPRVADANPNGSVFAEGFADWAAKIHFERWLWELDVKLQAAARQFGEELRTVAMERNGGNKHWSKRFVGHAAANRAVSILHQAGFVAAEDRVLVLARELTLHPAELQVKDAFVRNLGRSKPQLKDRLVAWANGDGSIDDLLSPLN